jgi:Tfp pilus assembly protein PilZ
MGDAGIGLSLEKIKSRIFQIVAYMPEAEKRKVNSTIISNSSEVENQKILTLLLSNISESYALKLLNQLEKWHQSKLTEMRGHSRKPSFIPVECSSGGVSFTDFIQDISNGGVFIQTNGNFFIGQKISLIFSLPKAKEEINVSSEVVRLDSEGIGVRFNEPLITF